MKSSIVSIVTADGELRRLIIYRYLVIVALVEIVHYVRGIGALLIFPLLFWLVKLNNQIEHNKSFKRERGWLYWTAITVSFGGLVGYILKSDALRSLFLVLWAAMAIIVDFRSLRRSTI